VPCEKARGRGGGGGEDSGALKKKPVPVEPSPAARRVFPRPHDDDRLAACGGPESLRRRSSRVEAGRVAYPEAKLDRYSGSEGPEREREIEREREKEGR